MKRNVIIGGVYYCLEGTQAKDTKFVYNDVKNITKESVEHHNSYRSSSKSFGVSAGIGSNGQIKSNGISGNISAPVTPQTKLTSKSPVKSSTSRGRGRGKKKKIIVLINLMKRVNKTIVKENLRERKQKIIEKLIQIELKVHKKDIGKLKKNTMI